MASTPASCPKAMAAASNGVWQSDNPIEFSVPLLIVQICLVLVITRTLAVLLKPLRQPRVIAEIIGGILLGPSALGKSSLYMEYIFPHRSLTVLETVSDLGLIFFLFLVGLELDLEAIKRTGGQAMSIAAAGISLPFIAGVGVSFILHKTIASDGQFAPFLVFMGVALSITAFPVLARILAERRLLTTDVGQMAMAAAAVNDVVAWILLALAVALSGTNTSPLIALWVLLCGVGFVVIMFVAVKPMMAKIASQVVDKEPINEMYVAVTLAGVLAAGFVTDAIGIHSIFGGFVFGLIVPKDGPFAALLIEKIEDFVTILMLPLYFATSGLKTNIDSIHGVQSGGLLLLVIMTACAGKILGTFLVAYLHKMSIKKSLTLGFLMNTKGLVELIVLNIGKDRKVLNEETFAIMVLMALFTTFITTPVVMALYKPARNPVPYKRRMLYMPNEKASADLELRLLACVHGMPNVHAIINLVEAARGTRRHPLHMFILHLLEFSERPSSIMKVQRVRRNGRPFWDQQHYDVDNIVVAFEAYGQLSKVMVRPMTTIARFEDMHEDICVTASDKRAAIIVLPFHKHSRPNMHDGAWEGHSTGLRQVIQKVLFHAPCSVGILVDRGIGITSLTSSSVNRNVAVLFYGGPDDREALALGYRMAEHPGVRLTVYRFVLADPIEHHVEMTMPQDGRASPMPHHVMGDGIEVPTAHAGFSFGSKFSFGHDAFSYMVTELDSAQESKLDEECLAMAKWKATLTGQINEGEAGTAQSIRYEEMTVSDPVRAALVIGKMEEMSLLIVGRGRKPSPLIAPFSGRQAEYAELGPVGEALTVAGPLEMQCSVLAVQQYDPELVQEAPPLKKVVDVSSPKASRLQLSPSLVVVTGPASPTFAQKPENYEV
ncbi:hypothetical protein GOP47_0013321 [Adiantum capillus-veneris]|uniref:Cation/H+ exchanger domain-containing protein n=1 Tax=Adiantum capillus-veneris TaxID=13818 RepID=A0A9D4UN96_ADICA|nr:hypothetical protein GOP47_0013321 [Adiantum capillus-veneris]